MHKAFFGDRERQFALTPALIPELERLTSVGIGKLCQKLVQGDFSFLEITETIRLAMIGGGTSPQEAAALVQTYIAASPLGDAHVLAANILTELWAGPESDNDAAATGDLAAALNVERPSG